LQVLCEVARGKTLNENAQLNCNSVKFSQSC